MCYPTLKIGKISLILGIFLLQLGKNILFGFGNDTRNRSQYYKEKNHCCCYASNPPYRGLDSSVVNLNNLLLKRHIDNPSPGADSLTGGKSVPSSHKKGELRI